MLIALLIFAASVLFTAVLIFSIMLALRSSAAYRVGVERACRSHEVIALVGEPVRAGFFVRGGVRGGGRVASLHVSLKGPHGGGRLEIRALKIDDGLRFDVLRFHSRGQIVNLLATAAT